MIGHQSAKRFGCRLTVSPQGINSSNITPRDFPPQPVDGKLSGLRSPQANQSSQERKNVKKGIERPEKQFLQLINVFISQD